MGLRIFLFAGLILHKVVWEIWKRKRSVSNHSSRAHVSAVKRAVKIAKILLLLFFLVQTLFLNVFPIKNAHPSVRIIGIVLFILGLSTAIAGRVNLGGNWRDLEDRLVMSDQTLVTQGLYHYVRHPIYAGDMFLIVGLQLALQSWLVLLALAIAVIVIRQTLAEEKLLVNSFPEYSQYCARTKRFVPFLV